MDQLHQSIGAALEPETVVKVMLRGPESWDKIACYFRHVITNKTKKEAEIQRITTTDPWTRGSTREEMCASGRSGWGHPNADKLSSLNP